MGRQLRLNVLVLAFNVRFITHTSNDLVFRLEDGSIKSGMSESPATLDFFSPMTSCIPNVKSRVATTFFGSMSLRVERYSACWRGYQEFRIRPGATGVMVPVKLQYQKRVLGMRSLLSPLRPNPFMSTSNRTLIVPSPFALFFFPRTCVNDGRRNGVASSPMLRLIQLRHTRRMGKKDNADIMTKLFEGILLRNRGLQHVSDIRKEKNLSPTTMPFFS